MAFPSVNNIAAPYPSPFFAEVLRRPPLPTNSAWQNLVLNNGTQPEYIHPYLLQSAHGSLSISYPNRVAQSGLIYQAFIATIIISALVPGQHLISTFDDLSLTLQLPGPITVPLVRGSPYITFIVEGGGIKISSNHTPLGVYSSFHNTKHKVVFDSGQTWLIYSSAPLYLGKDLGIARSYRGVIRIAVNPAVTDDGISSAERILDRYSPTYPVSGRADLSTAFRIIYKWEKRGQAPLLMLSHPVHRQILDSPHALVPELSYRSIDGDLVAIVGDSWILQESPIAMAWYSIRGPDPKDSEARSRVIESLEHDVRNLQPINNSATYFFGKAVARAARIALIGEEFGHEALIPTVQEFLERSLTPWLDGTFPRNGLVFDGKWGGIVSRDGANDSTADFGLGSYNDHHYHFGYFCYASAVLAKLNGDWARRFKPQIYSIVNDFLTGSNDRGRASYTRLRNFDLWTLHSWAAGLTEFPDGRNQESTSEAVNAYYSAALLGLAFGDQYLISTGSTLAALEIRSAKALWHVPSNSKLYEAEFVKENRVVGILWANKRDSKLWFAGPECRECRLGIQLLPLLPITEILFSDLDYARELVEWASESQDGDIEDGWKGFIFALEGVYDAAAALQKVKSLNSYDDGNSLTNLLWWLYTRARS